MKKKLKKSTEGWVNEYERSLIEKKNHKRLKSAKKYEEVKQALPKYKKVRDTIKFYNKIHQEKEI